MMDNRPANFRCRRVAAIATAATLAAAACGSEAPLEAVAETPSRRRPAAAADATNAIEADYYRARIGQVLGTDPEASRIRYQKVLDAYDADPVMAARAALELAGHAAAKRHRRVALDLIARASALGASAADVTDRASRLHQRLSSVSAEDIEVRGPSAPAVLTGVSAEAAERFAKAEELLAVYLRRRPSSRVEQVISSIRAKRAALESAERAYREVIALSEPTATAAAEFRIASMYYDLSLSLTYDLADEMVSAEARKLRSGLRSLAAINRRRARAGYRRSLEAAAQAPESADRWREAAGLGLTSVEDLLRGG
jgi:hypothetical protein